MIQIRLMAALLCLTAASGYAVRRTPQPKTNSKWHLNLQNPRLVFEYDGVHYVAGSHDFRITASPKRISIAYFEGFGDVDQWFRSENSRIEMIGTSSSVIASQGASLEFHGLYEKIDLDLAGTQKHLDFRFFAEPEADTSLIRLKLHDVDGLRMEADGSVTAKTPLGALCIHPPVFNDPFDGEIRRVKGRFLFLPKGVVTFQPQAN